jgi:hypothetical protein
MSARDMRGVRAKQDQEMAADLKRRGIFHGIRPSRTLADPMQYLHPDLVGTARYRRLRGAKDAG